VKQLFAFDLDGTLAESKQALGEPMAQALARLSQVGSVAIISGGDWPQFEKQVVSRLPNEAVLDRFFIMPTTGTKLYRHDGQGWHAVYADVFSPEERQHILDALDEAVDECGLRAEKVWGEQIEDRGSQITFSGLGQEAPLDAKTAWDPDRSKRKAIQAAAQKRLPDLSVNTGGSTSIDITRKGIDKAFGLKRLAEASGIPVDAMVFVGDAIYPGGNDYAPFEMGMDTVKVRDPEETLSVIATAVACLKR
jgi:phosphomannomutase